MSELLTLPSSEPVTPVTLPETYGESPALDQPTESEDTLPISEYPLQDITFLDSNSRTGSGRTCVPPEEQELKNKLRQGLVVATLAATALVGLGVQDIVHNRYVAAQDGPSVSHALNREEQAPNDVMVVDLSGLSGNDARYDAVHETAYQALGDVEAVRYGNAVNAEAIGKTLIEHAQKLGKDTIILSGRSMGGIVAINVARYILENSHLRIPCIILDSSPSSLDSVQDDRRSTADTLLDIVSPIPGAEDSSVLNYGIQYGAEVGSLGKFVGNTTGKNIAIARKVLEEMMNGKKASITLMFDEYNAVVAADMYSSIKALGDLPLERRPILALVQPTRTNPDGSVNRNVDTTVKSDVSAAEYKKYGKEAGVIVLVVGVDGIIHGNPGNNEGEWNKGMTEKVLPALELARRKVLEQVLQKRIWSYALQLSMIPSLHNPRGVVQQVAAPPLVIPTTEASKPPR